jgi:hypothetical protein
MRIVFAFGLMSLLSVSACASPKIGAVEAATVDEQIERQAIFDSVNRAVAAHDYVALDKMEDEFRTRRSLTPGGTWKLAAYYAGLGFALRPQTVGGCADAQSGFIDDWRAAAPHSPAANIIKARNLIDLAWCYRGDGYADTVSSNSWGPFRKNVQAARAAITADPAIAVDPEYYAVMLDLYLSESRVGPEYDVLLDRAIKQEPSYHRIYFNAVRRAQPQWGGSFAAVDALARRAADATARTEGAGGYARVYWTLADCDCRLDQMGVDWTEMQKGMDDVMDRYPVDWNAANFARIACRYGDQTAAARYYRQIKNDDGRAWSNKDEWQKCRSMALASKS